MTEKRLDKTAMQERLDRLVKEREGQEMLETKRKTDLMYGPWEKKKFRKEIKATIRKMLNKSERKFFSKLWPGKKPKSTFELTGKHINKRSFVCRLNKKIKGYGRIKGCMYLGQKGYFRFECPLLDK